MSGPHGVGFSEESSSSSGLPREARSQADDRRQTKPSVGKVPSSFLLVVIVGGAFFLVIAAVGTGFMFLAGGWKEGNFPPGGFPRDLPSLDELAASSTGPRESADFGQQTQSVQSRSSQLLQELLVPMPEVLRPDLAPEAASAETRASGSAGSSSPTDARIKPAGPWPSDPEATFSQFCSRLPSAASCGRGDAGTLAGKNSANVPLCHGASPSTTGSHSPDGSRDSVLDLTGAGATSASTGGLGLAGFASPAFPGIG